MNAVRMCCLLLFNKVSLASYQDPNVLFLCARRGRPIHAAGLLLAVLLSACLPTASPRTPAQAVDFGALVLDESFDVPAQMWDTINAEGIFVGAVPGGYQLYSELGGRFVWGAHYQMHDNALIEAEVRFLAESAGQALAGVMCRTSPQNNGRGYYFLISADGAFSIRAGSETSVEPLVPWQSTGALHTDGRENRIRAVCVGDYLAMSINGTAVGSVEDGRYNAGYTGLVVGLPPSAAPDAVVNVVVDEVRVWDAGR